MDNKNEGVVAWAFGVPSTIPSNIAISQMTSWVATEQRIPVFTQKAYIHLDTGVDVTYVKETPENPAATLEIAFQAVVWAREHGFSKLWIACAEPHLWRCKRDLLYAIRKADADIAIEVLPEVFGYPDKTWFCADSGQSFHHTRVDWNRNDRIMRAIPMWFYVHIYTRLRKILAPK